ncbi:MAG: membrane protein insertion efficiency factor YidD [Rickettsiales bacterium]|nr:MAG: membrane protein insertion efficiency factor YidD [Rickettsiales bacterium]
MKYPFLLMIKFYQFFISPWLGKSCRFYPSCSEYAKDAIIMRGVLYGLYLSAIRILKCQPFSDGGYDPVPEKRSSRNGSE